VLPFMVLLSNNLPRLILDPPSMLGQEGYGSLIHFGHLSFLKAYFP